MKTNKGFWVWSKWGTGRNEHKRLKTIVVRSPSHRDKAPKRKKVISKRPRIKGAFF
jgi:hypothetical protein